MVNPIFVEQEDNANGYLDCAPEPEEGMYTDSTTSPYVFANPLYGSSAGPVTNGHPDDDLEGGYDEIHPVGPEYVHTGPIYDEAGAGYLESSPYQPNYDIPSATGYLDTAPTEEDVPAKNESGYLDMAAMEDSNFYGSPHAPVNTAGEYQDVQAEEEPEADYTYMPAE